MRIISGTARGRQIDAPKGMTTRPVTDMIRESLFNIWQFDIEGATFLDLVAGSGCMGLEALSRGAARAVMVDAGAEQVRVIRANLKKTGLDACAHEVLKQDVFNVIERFGRTHRSFDIVYLDPPFTQPEMFAPLMEVLGNGALVAPGGQLVIRAEQRLPMPEEAGVLHKAREKRYGVSTVHFYETSTLSSTSAAK
jgi:16S rRNA (guanine(966)-N(2))-methyltransferase RsmD